MNYIEPTKMSPFKTYYSLRTLDGANMQYAPNKWVIAIPTLL